MERRAYLNRSRAFACLPKGVHQQPLADDPAVLVRYKGAAMWPMAYKLRFVDGTGATRHTAILRDKNANAIFEVPLAEVENYAD